MGSFTAKLMKFQNELLNFSKVFLFNVHLNCENTLNLINSETRGQQQKTLRTLRRLASLLVGLSHDIIIWNSYVISICWLKTHQFPHNWWQRSKQSDNSKLLYNNSNLKERLVRKFYPIIVMSVYFYCQMTPVSQTKLVGNWTGLWCVSLQWLTGEVDVEQLRCPNLRCQHNV